MLAIVSCNASIQRAEIFYKFFNKKIEENKYIKRFNIFNIENKSHYLYKYTGKIHESVKEALDTVPVPKVRHSFRDLANKFASIIRTFIEETDCDYLIRITDDVYINFDNFDAFMKEVVSYGNPRDKNLVLGDIIAFIEDIPFIQGGAGFLISRKAAYNFLINDFDFLRVANYEEDQVASHYIIKYSFLKHSMRFIGHLMMSLEDNRKRCTAPYYPIKDAVFFHHLHENQRHHTLKEIDDLIHNSSHRMWQHGKFTFAEMCRGAL